MDEAFLEDISRWREELAKDIYKQNIKELEDRTDEKKVKIQVKILNEAVQKILDRLIFIRIAEDRKIIEPKSLLEEVEWWKAGGKRRDLHKRLTDRFMGWNQDFNGEILKPSSCDVLNIDSNLLVKIIEDLYFPKCPYLFDVIGVELLGSIYERYLGKTIKVTPKRVKIEEKPEVRKAGGVYYTPQYIVDYIVKNTVGKKIKGKTPKQIEGIRILDPACGSGSFLLTAYQTLIDYHLDYYEKHPEESEKGILFPDVITDFNKTKRLSIEKKAQILKNNIFGVDIDAQAVEITMMSLYLKNLEGEKDLPRKKELLPSLAKNIRCGNSLISYDINNQLDLFDDEKKEKINPFDWRSKSTGFGEIVKQGGFDVIVGNPPYGRDILTEFKDYFDTKYESSQYKLDSFVFFLEKGLRLMNKGGKLGFIVPNTWLTTKTFSNVRKYILFKYRIDQIINLGKNIFTRANIDTMLIFINHDKAKNIKIIDASDHRLRSNRLQKPKRIFFLRQSDWMADNENRFNIFLSSKEIHVFNKIIKKSTFLDSLVECSQGLIPYNTKEMSKKNPYISDLKKGEKWKPLLDKGACVQRYYLRWNKIFIKFGSWLYTPNKPKFYENEKILIQRHRNPSLPRRIVATYDSEEFYFKDNLCGLIKRDNYYSLKYLLGVINSTLMNIFYSKFFTEVSLNPTYIKQLPIPNIDFSNPYQKYKHDKIVELVEKMIELNKKKNLLPPSSKRERIEREIQITDEQIDGLVYELHGITEEEKRIIEESMYL